MLPPFQALDVTNQIINCAAQRDISLDTLRLNKLLYLTHGWHLALTNGIPLINGEPFETWRFGPTLPGITRSFRWYGKGDIPPNHPLSKTPPLPQRYIDLIDRMLDIYGQYDIVELVGISQDAAWREIYHDSTVGPKLPDEKILEVFRIKMANCQLEDPEENENEYDYTI